MPPPDMRRFVSLLLLMLCAAPAGAVEIFVDNVGGDDLHDGSQPQSTGGAGPVRTLRKALLVARSGDRIVLTNTGEAYRESIALSSGKHSGTTRTPFVIDGQGAVLEGAEPVPPRDWEHWRGDVFRFRPSRTSFQQLFLDGQPATRRKLGPGEHHWPDIAPLEWFRRDAHVYFRVEPDRLPAEYALSCSARQTGVTLYHVHDVMIVNLVVQGFRLDGINVNDGVRDCVLAEVTCRGNGRSGIVVAGTSQVGITHSLVGDNGDSQLRVEGYSATRLEDTHLLDNTAPAIFRRGGELMIDGQITGEEPVDNIQIEAQPR
jgi:hypothetical protein